MSGKAAVTQIVVRIEPGIDVRGTLADWIAEAPRSRRKGYAVASGWSRARSKGRQGH